MHADSALQALCGAKQKQHSDGEEHDDDGDAHRC
jgi:hypothetical protein